MGPPPPPPGSRRGKTKRGSLETSLPKSRQSARVGGMGIFFANPWGLLALLGVPVVVAIHLLRRQARQVRVSTLFLVERALPSNEGGRRVRTLRNSLPLWAQISAVLALTWLLAGPRWIDSQSTQTVVAVFDSSASMGAFREETLAAAHEELSRIGKAAGRTQWIFLRSDGTRLASGDSLEETLAAAARAWDPVLGTHDPHDALRLARTLAGENGAVISFTDRPPARQDDVAWIAVGHPLENAGFVGGGGFAEHWSALVKNFGPTARDLRWRMAGDPDWKTVRLEAGATTEIAGPFPEGTDRVMLEIEGDRFVFDDRLPILRPRPKELALQRSAGPAFDALFEQIARLAEPAASAETPDVTLAVYNPLAPGLPDTAAVVFVEDVGRTGKPLSGLIVAEPHPLMDSLNWQGLIARETLGVPFREGDTALLWQGRRPLIFLRLRDGRPQLIFNFDVSQSNAARLPAFPLLVHRFFDLLRRNKPAPEAANVETRQVLEIAGAGRHQAPVRPEFFSVRGPDGSVLFDGAARFGDTRESDFSSAATGRSADVTVEAVRQANARGEFLDPLWAALLAGLMFWNWILTGSARKPGAGAPSGPAPAELRPSSPPAR